MLFLAVAVASCGVQSTVVDFGGGVTHAVVSDARAFNRNTLTVAVWVQLAQHCEPQVFVNRGARSESFTLYLYKGAVRFLVGTAPGSYSFAKADRPEIGKWTHYVGTSDGETIRIYKNGTLAGTTSILPSPEGRMPAVEMDAPLYLGSEGAARNATVGRLRDVRIFDRALTAEEVAAVHGGRPVALSARLGAWGEVRGDRWLDLSGRGRHAQFGRRAVVRKADEIRGIWYSNQPSGDEYRFKYAGGFATYPQQHLPIAIHCASVNKTFFTYGAADAENGLLHAVSYFDHATGKVARPTILLAKQTSDAHDNPVMSVDDRGYVWIFSASHGRSRPSFIHRSVKPYDIEAFERVVTTNFSYPQPWFVAGQGFCFLQTSYDGRRSLYCQRSTDGRKWSDRQLLASFGRGHYQVSWRQGAKIGTVFNYHPQKVGLNARTNLYYMETIDGGVTWRTVDGGQLDLPLQARDNPARIAEYESRGVLVYLKDLQFDEEGHPVIVYLTSRGFEAGPKNDPRTWRIRRWDGERWLDYAITTSDHNYDFGSLYLEAPDRWRLIAPTAPGPQKYNTGGEIEMWESADRGRSWRVVSQLTRGSEFNHTYVRRPVDAHPGFYGLWADGHGRRPSASSLYFTTRDGVVTRMR